jgi:hypothetical protein
MTSKTFRRSRQSRKSRRGGYGALANAASASVLPLGLTLWQQHYKRKNVKPNFVTRKFKTVSRNTPRN